MLHCEYEVDPRDVIPALVAAKIELVFVREVKIFHISLLKTMDDVVLSSERLLLIFVKMFLYALLV